MHSLVYIHKGNLLVKMKYAFVASFYLSPFTFVINKITEWHLNNAAYASLVLGAIIIDHFVGTVYHAFFKRDFSMRKNITGLMIKIFVVIAMAYLFEGLNILMSQESILKDYTVMVLRLMVFLYPAGNAFGNTYEITGKKFPPVGFMNKLKQFSEQVTINNGNDKIEEGNQP